ncbi:ATP-binding protein [Ancylobacter lacus]|uniref:ATP-binding protein n=1 Tax=Ancylobacter lacus TaxID=2579970 RepID=UPI0031B81EE6
MTTPRMAGRGTMTSLRARLTLLMVGAVMLVVVLASALSFQLLAPPRFDRAEEATAVQLALLADLAGRLPEGQAPAAVAGFGLRSQPAGQSDRPPPPPGWPALLDRLWGPPSPPEPLPPPGALQADHAPPVPPAEKPPGAPGESPPSRGINAALERLGRPERVIVSGFEAPGGPVISLKLAEGRWLVVPMATLTPFEDRTIAFLAWIGFITLGATLIAVMMVRRLVAPLALIERSVAAVGPDGEFAPLPEDGPAEVRAAASAVNRLSARLRSAMESRMRLVAAAGHDLRTPMTRLRLRAEFLEGDEREGWIADLDELDRIADSAIRLVREEVEHSVRNALALDELVREVTDDLGRLGLNARMAASEPAQVLARPLALQRAVRNLVINAATHGRGATVQVRCEGELAVVSIEDRGPGIPEALIDRAFEPFFRIDPARGQAVPGAGLGLAIAREIVTGNGGTLSLHNLPGGGLLQRMAFPRVPAAAEAAG